MATAPHLDATLAYAADLRRLDAICLPRSNDRTNPRTLRPGTLEHLNITTDCPNERWLQVLRQLHVTIYNGGATSLRNFLTLLQEKNCAEHLTTTVLRAVAAILYDRACSGDHGLIKEATKADFGNTAPQDDLTRLSWAKRGFLENMLLIDYGIGVYPLYETVVLPKWFFVRWVQPVLERLTEYMAEFASHCGRGQLPGWEGWLYLGRCLEYFHMYDPADAALMLYYYHTRRRLDRADYVKGMTGYAGVLHELVAEVPTRGAERLLRKLSVDVNEFIPQVVYQQSRRQRMISAAEHIAAQHGARLYAWNSNGTATPPPEMPPPETPTTDTENLPKQKKEESWWEDFRASIPEWGGRPNRKLKTD